MAAQGVRVVAHAGARGEEEPRVLVVDGRRLDVVAVTDRAREPEGRVFRVRLEDGSHWRLHCRESDLAWEARRTSGPGPAPGERPR